MKILVLGNSHLAVLKRSWHEASSQYVGLLADFMGRAGGSGGLTNLEICNGIIEPVSGEMGFFSSDPEKKFKISDFSAFVIIGYPQILITTKRYSKALLQRYVEDYVCSRTPEKMDAVAPLIKASTKAKVILIPEPFPINHRAIGDALAYEEEIDFLNHRFFSPLGYWVISQPIETLQNGKMATRSNFGINPNDMHHMSDDFGFLLWGKIAYSLRGP